MRFTFALLALCLAAGPAGAQVAAAPPPAPTPADTTNIRNFIFKNQAKQAITDGDVLLTNKGQVSFTGTKGPIQPDEVRTIQVPRDQCPQTITLRFANGVNQASNALTDCTKNNFTIFDDHITAD